MAVNCQQGRTPAQGDDVKIPAEASVQLLAVGQGFDAEMQLERDGQAQFYRFSPAHGSVPSIFWSTATMSFRTRGRILSG